MLSQNLIQQITLLISCITISSTTTQECLGKADIIFLLDGSDSISDAEFIEQKKLVEYFITQSDIGPDRTRVGVIVVSSDIGDTIKLTQSTSRNEIIQAVNVLQQPQDGSRIDLGINQLERMLYSEGRAKVTQIGIIVTDGRSKYPDASKGESEALKSVGIHLLCIGVGRLVDEKQLSAMAFNPNEYFYIEPLQQSVDKLLNVTKALSTARCTEIVKQKVEPVTTKPQVQPVTTKPQVQPVTSKATTTQEPSTKAPTTTRPIYAPPQTTTGDVLNQQMKISVKSNLINGKDVVGTRVEKMFSGGDEQWWYNNERDTIESTLKNNPYEEYNRVDPIHSPWVTNPPVRSTPMAWRTFAPTAPVYQTYTISPGQTDTGSWSGGYRNPLVPVKLFSIDMPVKVNQDVATMQKQFTTQKLIAPTTTTSMTTTLKATTIQHSVQPKPVIRTEVNTDSKPDSRPDINTDTKTDVRPDTNTDRKSDIRTDISTDKKADVRPDTNTDKHEEEHRKQHAAGHQDLCYGSQYVDGVGYNADPKSCNEFVQCFYEGGQIKVERARCPFRMFWDQRLLLCRPATSISCWRDPCFDFTVRSYDHKGNCRAHWTCRNGLSQAKCCRMGFSYSEEKQECVPEPGCNDWCEDSGELTFTSPFASCRMTPFETNERFYFEEIPGLGMMTRSCPRGSQYNPGLCTCDRSDEVRRESCRPELILDFQDGFTDKSGNNLAVTPENVHIESGAARFDGSGKIRLWRFSGVSYGSKFTITMKYKENPDTQTTEPMHLLSNCFNPEVMRPSIDIAISPNKGAMFLATTDKGGEQMAILKYNSTDWKTLSFVYDGKYLTGSINGMSSRVPLQGVIEERPSALILGACDYFGGYGGLMDDVKLYLCVPHGIT